MSAAVVLLMAASALGWGSLILRLARVADDLPWRERLAWSLGLGMGVIGWLGFFPPLLGLTQPWAFALCLSLGLPGLRLLGAPPHEEPPGRWTWALLALGTVFALGDLAEGLAPPIDADNLACHFAIPREILRRGHLIVTPCAAHGAIPLLPQTTFLVALALGGEQAMTLWAGLSGWISVALTYAVARRFMGRDWSLALALGLAGLPATLQTAVSGQVGAVTTMAVLGVLEARRRPGPGWAVVAGLAAGVGMASQYLGLPAAFLCGLAVLVQRGGVPKAAAFTAAALFAGSQWYGWSAWNAGAFLPVDGIDAERAGLGLLPVLLIGVLAAALRVMPRTILAAGLGVVLLIQTEEKVVFARPFVQSLLAGESRAAFLRRNVGYGYAVDWANANLSDSDVVATTQRQWRYLMDPGILYLAPDRPAGTETRAENADLALFWQRMRAHGVTHAMVPLSETAGGSDFAAMVKRLNVNGCARMMAELHGPAPTRIPGHGGGSSVVVVYALSPDSSCGQQP